MPQLFGSVYLRAGGSILVSDVATLFVAWKWGQLPPRTEPIATGTLR